MPTPQLDSRKSGDLLAQASALAALYVPDWSGISQPSDPGRQIVDCFIRLMELLVERQNRIPELNFIKFLDLVGVEQFAGSPARVPVTFLLASNAVSGAVVPSRTRVATTQTQENVAPVFETTGEFFATPSTLLQVVSLVPEVEGYARLNLGSLPPKPVELQDLGRATLALAGKQGELAPVPHVLYLGSAALFGRKETVDVTLVFPVAGGDRSTLTTANLKWKRFDAQTKAWVDLNTDDLPAGAGETRLKLHNISGAGKTTVHGREGFFVAGHLDGFQARSLAWPVLSGVSGFPETVSTPAGILPDLAFADGATLDLSKPVLPFGERPRYGAAFYLGSRTAFSPEVRDVTLKMRILPYTNDQLIARFDGINKPTSITTDLEWQYLRSDGSWQSIATCRHMISATPATPLAPPTKSKTALPPATNLVEMKGSGALFGDPNVDGAADIEIKLTLNPNIGLQTVSGAQSYWIRAVLRSQQPYGSDGFVIAGTAGTPPKFVGPLYVPPTLESITLSYTHRAAPIPLDAVLAENNFETVDHTAALATGSPSIRPFIPVADHIAEGASGVLSREPALYLGFNQALGGSDARFISLFVHLHEPASQATSPVEGGAPRVAWEYFADGRVWRPLAVQDETLNMTTSGTVGFLTAGDAVRLRLFEGLAGKETQAIGSSLFWCRARLTSGTYDHPPRILGVYLNTVMAENRITFPDDVPLGSGNGKPGQIIQCVQSKILDAELWVREQERPNDIELEQLRHEIEDSLRLEDPNARLNADALVDTRKPGEPDESILVRWQRVPNFLASKPRSRHFTLDRVAGIVAFGDGKQGLIPPIGRDNLVFRGLATGGGEEANRAATVLAVKELKTSLPFVDKLFNVAQATGGAKAWSRQDTLDFGPQTIKNRGRAITTEDYEWMVRERFGQIAKVRCLPTKAPGPSQNLVFQPGAVTIIVVPKGVEPLPQPPNGLLRAIQEFLREKSLGSIVEDVHVIGAAYQPVPVRAILKAASSSQASLLTGRAAAALDAWLHPLTGGDDGRGWEFGRDVYSSEVFAVLARVPGVDHVEVAEFSDQPGAITIDVPENGLTASGPHRISVN